MSRKIQAPGIELNEYDRSGYNQTQDYSIVGTTSLIAGVADEGEDYTIQWVNSKQTLKSFYGTPQNEAEMYFYNAGIEILNKGGICLMAKLPYDNEAKDNFNAVTYNIDSSITQIHEISVQIEGNYVTVAEIKETVLNIAKILNRTYVLNTIQSIKYAVEDMLVIQGIEWENYSTLQNIKNAIEELIMNLNVDSPYAWLRDLDSYLTSYVKIQPDSNSSKITLDTLDTLITGNKTSVNNKIKIVDITRGKYAKSDDNNIFVKHSTSGQVISATTDFLGIIPVLVSPANAIYFQNVTNTELSIADISKYDILSSITTVFHTGISFDSANFINTLVQPLSTNFVSSDFAPSESYSKDAASYFPNINYIDSLHLDSTHLKDIGVVVFKAYASEANRTQTSLAVVESFVGSLDSSAKDENTKASRFIDDVVNANSQYIKLFSKANPTAIEQAKTIVINNQLATSLGFYEVDLTKRISYTNSIIKPLNVIFERAKDKNAINVDLVIDAGTSTLAQLAASRGGDVTFTNQKWRISDLDHDEAGIKYLNFLDTTIKAWKTILQKYDTFCKFTRKDCLFIADGLRQFCLNGNSKLVRSTKLNSSVALDILPNLKYMQCLNSSYSTGYSNWFQIIDDYTGEYIWCPPSIKAAGIYTYTDAYYHKWDAPAGIIRGKVNTAIDCAFSPNIDEAGKIYTQAWNYAVSYPLDGIILEGQKTFQIKKTAMDRVNVRRLFLYLEKSVVRIAKYFLYQGNTAYLRQRLVDTIKPIFDDAVNGQGILEYVIKCDDGNNTPQTIDNNELHCQIAIKPVKTTEFIVLDFVCTNQSATVNEKVFNGIN